MCGGLSRLSPRLKPPPLSDRKFRSLLTRRRGEPGSAGREQRRHRHCRGHLSRPFPPPPEATAPGEARSISALRAEFPSSRPPAPRSNPRSCGGPSRKAQFLSLRARRRGPCRVSAHPGSFSSLNTRHAATGQELASASAVDRGRLSSDRSLGPRFSECLSESLSLPVCLCLSLCLCFSGFLFLA